LLAATTADVAADTDAAVAAVLATPSPPATAQAAATSSASGLTTPSDAWVEADACAAAADTKLTRQEPVPEAAPAAAPPSGLDTSKSPPAPVTVVDVATWEARVLASPSVAAGKADALKPEATVTAAPVAEFNAAPLSGRAFSSIPPPQAP
jgi:hypothetical protein